MCTFCLVFFSTFLSLHVFTMFLKSAPQIYPHVLLCYRLKMDKVLEEILQKREEDKSGKRNNLIDVLVYG